MRRQKVARISSYVMRENRDRQIMFELLRKKFGFRISNFIFNWSIHSFSGRCYRYPEWDFKSSSRYAESSILVYDVLGPAALTSGLTMLSNSLKFFSNLDANSPAFAR